MKSNIAAILIFLVVFSAAGYVVIRAEEPLLDDIRRLEREVAELQDIHAINRDLVQQVTELQIKLYILEQEREVLRGRVRELEQEVAIYSNREEVAP